MDEPRIAPKPTISRLLMVALSRRLGESSRYATIVTAMPTTNEQLAFLATVSELNAKHNAVRTDSETRCLFHSFWTKSEIDHGQQIQSEWDVPVNMIPFYGDWHD